MCFATVTSLRTFIRAGENWENALYLRKRESISSMNIMQGDNFAAKVKTAVANFWDSPYHLSVICETSKLINLAPASLAVAYIKKKV